MSRSYRGDIRLKLEMETDISTSEKLRRGIKYSSPRKVSAETLEYESLRDQVLAARISRAAKRKVRERCLE